MCIKYELVSDDELLSLIRLMRTHNFYLMSNTLIRNGNSPDSYSKY